MVHVKKCPCSHGRGKPTTEFYDNGKPQIYCMGWVDKYNDEPFECCKNCSDWVYGEQCEKDFDERVKRMPNEEAIELLNDMIIKVCILKSAKTQIYNNNALDMGIKALGKQIPKKPILFKGCNWIYSCPNCRKLLFMTDEPKNHGVKYAYCPDCGQHIDWGEA